MARFLLRDGNKISASIDPRTLDVYSYKDKQGNVVYAMISARAERQLLSTIPMPSLPMQARMKMAINRISA